MAKSKKRPNVRRPANFVGDSLTTIDYLNECDVPKACIAATMHMQEWCIDVGLYDSGDRAMRAVQSTPVTKDLGQRLLTWFNPTVQGLYAMSQYCVVEMRRFYERH